MFRKNSITLVALVLLPLYGLSQKGTQSPYSVFGIGQLNQGQYAAFMAMGGVSAACTDSTIVNSSNPASYVYFNRNRPVFQFGANGKFSSFETTTATSTQSTLGLNQIQLGLPIKKNWGAIFGLVPYSFTGYTIANYELSDGDTINQAINEGSGAVSKLTLGLAYRPLNYYKKDTVYRADSTSRRGDTSYVDKWHVLAIGVNGNYLFGSSDRLQSYEYVNWSNAYNSRVKNSLRITDANLDFGINYQYIFRPPTDSLMNGSVSVGATYTPGFGLRAYQDLLSYTYIGSFYGGTYGNGGVSVVDTIENVIDNQGLIFIPEQYKFAVEYRLGWQPSKKGERQLRLGAEMNFQKWSSYYEDFGTISYAPFRDRLGLAFGLEYSPVISNDPSIGILARTNYRLGFNYTQTELNLNGTGIDDYGMSFGLGIPVNINSTNTNINIGASLGNMGTTDNGLIREQYVGVFFGISIMPDQYDRWFMKRKYD